MGIFNQKSRFRVAQEVRTVRKVIETPRSTPSLGASGSKKRALDGSAPSAKSHLLPSPASNGPDGRSAHHPRAGRSNPLKRKAVSAVRSNRRSLPASPSYPSFSGSDDSDDEGDDWEAHLDARKRQRRVYQQQQRAEDKNRVLRHPAIWTGDQEDDDEAQQRQEEAGRTTQTSRADGATKAIPPVIHAVESASLAEKCEPALGLSDAEVAVELQYPGARDPERYELVWGRDKIEATKDILTVVQFVATIYLKDDENERFLNQNTGIHRRLERSNNTTDGRGFKAALQDFNTRLRSLQSSGVIARNLGAMHGIPRELAAFMLDQVYDRTVAPKIELLAKYQNGTDNVYGELLHPFVSDILVTRTKMTSDMVFVDLGSGVGNVVLQAALEIGCESWGCEMMENACNLAEAQQREFLARCRLWGIAPGAVRLERGDFRRNEAVLAVLKRADVVLVNNQAFTTELNSNLVNMFLDLKVGCRIVSLKTFVHDNKLAENDVASSILDVEHLTYPEEYVSWTSAGGTFCISTKKGSSA